MALEAFNDWRERLGKFLSDQGLPSHEIWIDWGDIIVHKGQFYVKYCGGDGRISIAEARFLAASEKDVGISLEGVCTTNDATFCFAHLPANEDEAARMMIPQHGVKLSVPTHRRKAKLVTNRLTWWLLKFRGEDFLRILYA